MKIDQHISRFGTSFLRGFVDHPASVNETYIQHALFAGRFSLVLFAAGGAALIHAIIPPMFQTTASRLIAKLHSQMHTRH